MTFLVTDLMTTHLITIRDDDLVTILIELFNHTHISGVPVIDNKGGVLGVISKTDLMSHLSQQHLQANKDWGQTKVKDILPKHGAAVIFDTDVIATAAHVMKKFKIHRVLVKNHANQIVGIISTFDLLKMFDGEFKNISATQNSNADNKPDLLEIPMPKHPDPLIVLSARELQVLALVAEGKTDNQIMKILQLSDDWLHGYMHNILEKLHVSNDIQAVRRAVEAGIIKHAPILDVEPAV